MTAGSSPDRAGADALLRLLKWLRAHDLPDELVLTCGHEPSFDVSRDRLGVRVDGCVCRCSIDVPLQLLALGVPRLAVTPCAQHRDQAAAMVHTWERLTPGAVRLVPVSEVGPRALHRRGTVLHAASIPLPRRDVIGLGLLDRSRPDVDTLDLTADGPGRTVDSLRILRRQGRAVEESVEEPGDGGPELPVVGASLAVQGCAACGVCVRACPVGALELDIADGTADLVHHADLCRGRLRCVELCPYGAVKTAGPLDAGRAAENPVTALARVDVVGCPRCGAVHPAVQGQLCRVCAFRERAPFGSVLPGGQPARQP